jgi:SAM-dependent methyltransferase
MTSLPDYYSRRAPDYEKIWHREDPIRQGEQREIVSALRQIFKDRKVIEVACGTGYWTQFLAESAREILAVDISDEMLALARGKHFPPRVRMQRADAYELDSIQGNDFDGGLANFWISHVPKARLPEFLDGFHARLTRGAVVFMADNVYVEGVGGPLVARPGVEDTFKLRALGDGSTHEVLKNYFTADELRNIFAPRGRDFEIHVGRCFWWIKYVVNNGPRGTHPDG